MTVHLAPHRPAMRSGEHISAKPATNPLRRSRHNSLRSGNLAPRRWPHER